MSCRLPSLSPTAYPSLPVCSPEFLTVFLLHPSPASSVPQVLFFAALSAGLPRFEVFPPLPRHPASFLPLRPSFPSPPPLFANSEERCPQLLPELSLYGMRVSFPQSVFPSLLFVIFS